MKKLTLFAAALLMASPAMAKKFSNTVDETTLQEIARINRTSKDNDKYEVCIHAYGTFNSATLTYKVSTDGGSNTSAIQYASSTQNGRAPVISTAADNFCLSWGFGTDLDDAAIFYASASSGASGVSVTIDAFDNQ